jgi:hypothetical protein
MTTYSYPFTDFAHGVSLELLGRQIVDVVPPFVPVYEGSSSATDVTISFSSDLSPTEETTLNDIVANHDPTGYSFAPNYQSDSYTASRRLASSTWYAVKTLAGELLYKVEETSYTYDVTGAYLVTETWKRFSALGNVVQTKNYTYETITNPDGTIFVRKIES